MHVSESQPYPWPYDGMLSAARVAVVLAGLQDHWLDRCDAPGEPVQRSLELAATAQQAGAAVVAIRYGRSDATGPARRHLPATGTGGWQLRTGDVQPDVVVDSVGLDAFHGSPLDALLRSAGRDRLVFGGAAAEITVDSTLRGANDRGYECLVVRDACAAVDPLLHARALDSVTMSGGIFGAIAFADATVEALSQLEEEP